MGKAQAQSQVHMNDSFGANQKPADDYRPASTVRDLPPKGNVTRIKGIKTGRLHHLLAGPELDCFYLFDWSKRVLNIRERYALPLSETIRIADQLGIDHPKDAKSKEPKEFVTGFLLDITEYQGNNQQRAIRFRQSSQLSVSYALHEMEIERAYWESHGVTWKLVTEREIATKNNAISNIEWIHSSYFLEEYPHLLTWADPVEEALFCLLEAQSIPLSVATSQIDEKLGLSPGSSLTVCRHLIATQKWKVDMNRKINPSNPLQVVRNLEFT